MKYDFDNCMLTLDDMTQCNRDIIKSWVDDNIDMILLNAQEIQRIYTTGKHDVDITVVCYNYLVGFYFLANDEFLVHSVGYKNAMEQDREEDLTDEDLAGIYSPVDVYNDYVGNTEDEAHGQDREEETDVDQSEEYNDYLTDNSKSILLTNREATLLVSALNYRLSFPNDSSFKTEYELLSSKLIRFLIDNQDDELPF